MWRFVGCRKEEKAQTTFILGEPLREIAESKDSSEQECIPVGCVPSAAVAISGGGILSRGMSAYGGVCPDGLSAWGFCEGNDWQTCVKTLPFCNYYCGGLKSFKSLNLKSALDVVFFGTGGQGLGQTLRLKIWSWNFQDVTLSKWVK